VRNSGATTVVEGIGDHGCEYMTGGRALILGKTGRNFAAGMSGGLAWVFNPDNSFAENCNTEMVDLDPLSLEDEEQILALLRKHIGLTGSKLAQQILTNWNEASTQFVKVYPKEYKRVLEQLQYQTIG
jgi:glutamate synthase (NADPH/NADH) large chain